MIQGTEACPEKCLLSPATAAKAQGSGYENTLERCGGGIFCIRHIPQKGLHAVRESQPKDRSPRDRQIFAGRVVQLSIERIDDVHISCGKENKIDVQICRQIMQPLAEAKDRQAKIEKTDVVKGTLPLQAVKQICICHATIKAADQRGHLI